MFRNSLCTLLLTNRLGSLFCFTQTIDSNSLSSNRTNPRQRNRWAALPILTRTDVGHFDHGGFLQRRS